MASSFPVHFCSAALHGASGYTHQDAAPLRVLSRLLSSKYLHVEIREKGIYKCFCEQFARETNVFQLYYTMFSRIFMKEIFRQINSFVNYL